MNPRYAVFLWLLRTVLAQNSSCDFYQSVTPGVVYSINSPGYPNNYKGGLQCRWTADCPTGYNCRVNCPLIDLLQSQSCNLDRLLISRSGDPQLAGADTYCGRGSLTAVSTGQRMTVGLITNPNTQGGKFACELIAQVATPTERCKCGERRQNRIVGGEETGVNEYKMMVGLIDVSIRQIKCGAVIISERYGLTAAHCVINRNVNDMAIVVGEHDITTGDSPATKVYRIASFTKHPYFSDSNYDYDIAIITAAESIEFNELVGPACLPFKFVNVDLAGKKVTILGWGTTSFGGPDSKVLLKAVVDVISQSKCAAKVSSVTPRQICTFTPGKDTCQDDSGGPLLYTDPDTGLLFNVGIASYGSSCAADSPGINTNVSALLNWIVSNTKANYCVK